MIYSPVPDAVEAAKLQFAAASLRLQASMASGALALLNFGHVLTWIEVRPKLAEEDQ